MPYLLNIQPCTTLLFAVMTKGDISTTTKRLTLSVGQNITPVSVTKYYVLNIHNITPVSVTKYYVLNI